MNLTCEELRRVLDYDPETGIFTWKEPRSNSVMIGQKAGSKNNQGYLSIEIGRTAYKSHRLAWFYVTGEWPAHQIDHINGVRDDNRFVNLRLATHAENSCNRRLYKNNSSGLKGVSFDSRNKKWKAQIRINNDLKYLGLFTSPEAAHTAYRTAARKYHGEFASFGDSHSAREG